mmetsp:Transcript_102582/g.244535  ORF Transcript_102582/g.244535 Transcript_102582/m.244535 type:complete len:200 (-) Transcript_102582:505-1104(-)
MSSGAASGVHPHMRCRSRSSIPSTSDRTSCASTVSCPCQPLPAQASRLPLPLSRSCSSRPPYPAQPSGRCPASGLRGIARCTCAGHQHPARTAARQRRALGHTPPGSQQQAQTVKHPARGSGPPWPQPCARASSGSSCQSCWPIRSATHQDPCHPSPPVLARLASSSAGTVAAWFPLCCRTCARKATGRTSLWRSSLWT